MEKCTPAVEGDRHVVLVEVEFYGFLVEGGYDFECLQEGFDFSFGVVGWASTIDEVMLPDILAELFWYSFEEIVGSLGDF